MKASDIKNAYIHLTNVAIQKTDSSYDNETGCKWSMHSLKQYLISRHGLERTNRCFHEIQNVIIRSLLGVQKVMIHDKACFELYGYDIMLDSDLTPWLIEVNASPSLSANTKEDYQLKCDMLHDCLDIVDVEARLRGDERSVGGFDLVYDGGVVEPDPQDCPWSTRLGTKVERENDGGD